jgi:uncharacterized protein
MKIYTDLDQIREMAERNHDENIAFRSYITQVNIDGRQLDAMVEGLTLRAMAGVDCIACHNCCDLLTIQATDLEVGSMSHCLGLSTVDFTSEYITPAPLADPVLRKKAGALQGNYGCALLDNGACTVYQVRPAACRAYPLMLGSDFRSRLWAVVDNCQICPIVSAVYEEMKVVLRPWQ